MQKIEDKIANIEFYAPESIRFLGGLSYEQFVQDHKTVAATSMMVIAMAEVMRELPEAFKEKNPSIDWFQIEGMRNRLAHQYRDFNLPMLFEALTIKMPGLIEKLSQVKY